MRALDTTTFELRLDSHEFFQADGYAILSHRWVGQEITFDEIAQYAPSLRDAGEQRIKSPQLDKIRGVCTVARRQGLRWMWIDNCCINKSSATEEAESINSMFKWYRDARVCITYLSDVRGGASPGPPAYHEAVAEPSMKKDPPPSSSGRVFQRFDRDGDKPSEWFFRGWTLQELLAPRAMDFYDADWNFMGTRSSLAAEISRVSGIGAPYLTGVRDFRRGACIATKMSWAAGRRTTRAEDVAYSLSGLFGVAVTPQYGEGGARAFMRLQQELLATTEDESLFAWKMPGPVEGIRYDVERSADANWAEGEWGLLAPSPDWFRGCGNVTVEPGSGAGREAIQRPARAFHLSRQGIVIPIMPSEGFNRYKVIMLLSPLLLIGAIPVWIYVAKKMKKKAQGGVPFVLNVWPTAGVDGGADRGAGGAISVYLSMLPTDSYAGDQEYRFKRTRCEELGVVGRYAVRGWTGEGVALQPEVRFGS